MLILLLLAVTSPAASDATRFALVQPAVPDRPHLDLGPVLVREGSRPKSPAELAQALDLAARELGAEVLVLERRDLREVYLVQPGSTASTVALNVASALLGGTFLGGPRPSSVSITSFYRAYRLVPEVPAKVDSRAAPVSEAQRRALASANDLSAQLALAHGWLASGGLELGAYVELRRFLCRRV